MHPRLIMVSHKFEEMVYYASFIRQWSRFYYPNSIFIRKCLTPLRTVDITDREQVCANTNSTA